MINNSGWRLTLPPVDKRDDEDDARAAGPDDAAEPEEHDPLVLADDPDREDGRHRAILRR